MNDNENIIEEARAGLAAFDEYWGDGGPVEAAYGRPWELIRRLLAVFEKAHPPTDDERDSVAEVIDQHGKMADSDYCECGATWSGQHLAAALLGDTREFGIFGVGPLVRQTGDEQEARLEYVIDAAVPVDDFPSWRFRYSRRIAEAVHAAGFRRSEVPEPSADDEEYDARLGDGDRDDPEPQGESNVSGSAERFQSPGEMKAQGEPPVLPEREATPDEAWDLGRIAGYDEAMREVAQGEPSGHRDRIALAEFIDKALDGDAGYGVGEFLAGGILSFLSERTALHAAFEPQGEPSDAQALDRVLAKLDRIPDSDAVTLDKADLRAVLRAASAVTEQRENRHE